MSRKWGFILAACAFLSVGALIGTLIAPRSVEAAKEPAKAVAPHIAYVNIAMVMREYDRAKTDNEKIAKRRQEYVEQAKELRDEIQRLSKLATEAQNQNDREAAQLKALETNRKLEDVDLRAKRELGESSEHLIVDVFTNIREVIAELAKERGLDVVEAFPDALNERDMTKPAVAQLKLQTPALYPYFIRKEFDLTEAVIERLNEKSVSTKKPTTSPANKTLPE
jgi:Skp family chaperone for outer membrane proteins